MYRFSRFATIVTLVLGMFVTVSSAPAGENKSSDVQYGVTPDGRLKLLFTEGLVVLQPIESGPLTGWGADEPGFFSIINPIPEEAMSPLAPSNNIVVQVVGAGLDNGLKAWLPGFGAHLGNGPFSVSSWDLGPDHEDSHPFWHIDPTTAGFVGPLAQTEWNATFRIIDTGATGYLPSDPITMTFAPEPGSLAMLAVGAAALLRRNRRTSSVN